VSLVATMRRIGFVFRLLIPFCYAGWRCRATASVAKPIGWQAECPPYI
jgi:hypothetical protein